MNEQPFADPANPTTPNPSSRERLTKQLAEMNIATARCIAANDAKGAVILLLQQNALMMALLIDELQSMQQMFERVDKRLVDLPQILKAILR
jgi:hypothetical protein